MLGRVISRPMKILIEIRERERESDYIIRGYKPPFSFGTSLGL